jgi:hypothetical protein
VPPNGAFGKDFNADLAGLGGFLVLAGAFMAAALRLVQTGSNWFKLVQIDS